MARQLRRGRRQEPDGIRVQQRIRLLRRRGHERLASFGRRSRKRCSSGGRVAPATSRTFALGERLHVQRRRGERHGHRHDDGVSAQELPVQRPQVGFARRFRNRIRSGPLREVVDHLAVHQHLAVLLAALLAGRQGQGSGRRVHGIRPGGRPFTPQRQQRQWRPQRLQRRRHARAEASPAGSSALRHQSADGRGLQAAQEVPRFDAAAEGRRGVGARVGRHFGASGRFGCQQRGQQLAIAGHHSAEFAERPVSRSELATGQQLLGSVQCLDFFAVDGQFADVDPLDAGPFADGGTQVDEFGAPAPC